MDSAKDGTEIAAILARKVILTLRSLGIDPFDSDTLQPSPLLLTIMQNIALYNASISPELAIAEYYSSNTPKSPFSLSGNVLSLGQAVWVHQEDLRHKVVCKGILVGFNREHVAHNNSRNISTVYSKSFATVIDLDGIPVKATIECLGTIRRIDLLKSPEEMEEDIQVTAFQCYQAKREGFVTLDLILRRISMIKVRMLDYLGLEEVIRRNDAYLHDLVSAVEEDSGHDLDSLPLTYCLAPRAAAIWGDYLSWLNKSVF